MIINLYGDIDGDGNIQFLDFPVVYFVGKHSVHVNEMGIKWKRKLKTSVNGRLSSSMIDKCPINPRQQLLFFYDTKGSDFTFVTPTRPQMYKIQCPSLNDSVFNLQLSEKQEIENIYLQLEFSDERFQQIREKSV